MKATFLKSIPYALSSSVLLCALNMQPVQAEDVKLYDQPPSAAEMGKLLFGGSSATAATEEPAPTGIKMRSIGFAKKVAPEVSNPTAIANSAKTELASIGLPIKFAQNSDEILTESIPFLIEIGKMLSMNEFADKRIIIEGHTDAAGAANYNQQLSQRRAEAVSRYLNKEFNIASSRLTAHGLGETKPLPGHAPEDEANRRVQFYSAN
jgi:OmpA-OmpF porin, OOP family